ncbi:hypothetical protein BB561_002458 [Smittium simulii]|uniref:Trafficking protein particle complex subunit n=1 Tax=Smittium simulii TaxID=133385 RepID=A0A2T9YQC5_9FUNG|nr:hypothetical protein BB561_002458 [Smittium simulii]
MIYNLYFFNRFCDCIFYAEWSPSSNLLLKPESREKSAVSSFKQESDRKSMFTINSAQTKKLNTPTPSTNTSLLHTLPNKGPYLGSLSPTANRALYNDQRSSISSKASILRYEDKRVSVLASTISKNTPPSIPEKGPEISPIPQLPLESSLSDNFSIIDAWKLDKTNPNDPLLEEGKLVYGAVFSIRNIVNKLHGSDGAYGKNLGDFYSYKTKNYKCHYFESPSGLKIVLNSDPHASSLQFALEHIYTQIYVEFITKNPSTNVKQRDQTFDQSDGFKAAINSYIQSLPAFNP